MLLPVLLWSLSRAYAQEVPTSAPVPPPAPVVSIGTAAAWVEERGTAGFDSRLASLARSVDGTNWLLGLEDGTIYRSMDGARSWSRVLRSPNDRRDEPDEEQLLLEGGAVVEEDAQRAESQSDSVEDQEGVASTETSVSVDADAEASVVDSSGAPRDLGTAESVDLDRVATDPLLKDHDTEDRPATVWFDPVDAEVALAGRSDGIWRSTDSGLHWTRVDSAADAWRFLAVPKLGIVVAGSSNGVRVSPDGGGRWFDTVDVTDGLEVRALTLLGDTLVAGTAGGLVVSTDGLRWKRLAFTGAVTGLLADPGWPGGMWVTTPGGVMRTDDAGKSFYTAGRQVMPGLRGLAPLAGQGHLATWGTDGVWESMDGGVTWHPVYQGLRDPDVRDLVVVGDQPVIVASRSVWRLGVSVGGSQGGMAAARGDAPVAFEEQQLLGLLVDVATRRAGLRLDTLNPHALAIKPLLPAVHLEAIYGRQVGRDSQPLAGQTVENADGAFELRAMVCFGGCAANAVIDFADTVDSYAAEIGDASGELADLAQSVAPEVYTLDGELMGADTEAFAATNTAQGIRKYRGQVSDQVVGAWATLQTTVHTPPPPSLSGAVDRLLDIQEAEARLDLYTEGAYTRARTSENVR